MTASAWTCPNCGIALTTPFCPGCGERPIGAIDLSLKGIAAQLMKTIAGVDGRVLRSVRALLLQPGSLTLAYGEGRRKPFIGPFQLFLLANVVFFAVQSLTHTRVFSSSLDSHLHHQDWSVLAQELVGDHLAAANTTLDRFTPLFDRAVVLHAKSLVIAMVYSDYWADTTKAGVTARPSMALKYTGNVDPADDLVTPAPTNGIVNFPTHVAPIFTRNRTTNGVNTTCTGCHSDPDKLDLRASISGTGRMKLSRDALPDKHFEHVRDVREGARGATGFQGGGCGCN